MNTISLTDLTDKLMLKTINSFDGLSINQIYNVLYLIRREYGDVVIRQRGYVNGFKVNGGGIETYIETENEI